jgi:hypothetical protein
MEWSYKRDKYAIDEKLWTSVCMLFRSCGYLLAVLRPQLIRLLIRPYRTYCQLPTTFDLYLLAYLLHFLFCIALSLWSLVTYSVRKLWNCVKSVATATQTCHYMDHLQITVVYISQVIFIRLLLNLVYPLLITDRPNPSSIVITTPLNMHILKKILTEKKPYISVILLWRTIQVTFFRKRKFRTIKLTSFSFQSFMVYALCIIIKFQHLQMEIESIRERSYRSSLLLVRRWIMYNNIVRCIIFNFFYFSIRIYWNPPPFYFC